MSPFFPLPSQAGPIRHLDRKARWSVPISSVVTVVNDPPYRLIYVHGLLHSRFHLASPLDERYALVQLCEAGFITQKRLAEAYGYDHDTINLWVKRYRRYGLAGLARGNPARLKPQDPSDPASVEPPPVEQLHLELTDPPPPSEPQPVPAPEEPAPPASSSPEPQEPAAQVAVLRPGEVRPSRYLSLLLALPFLQQALAPVFAYLARLGDRFPSAHRLWRIQDLLVGLVLLFFSGVPNIEQTKSLHRHEWGVLLAWRRLPSCRTLRRLLPWLSAHDLPRVVGPLLADRYLELKWVQPGLWHGDGHFVPYHGQGNLLHGYWPQRRGGYKGFYHYWTCDRRGRPLRVLVVQAVAAFPHILPDLTRETRTLEQQRYPDGLVVFTFDRGGWSAEVFQAADRAGVVFVTWKKHARPLQDEAFVASFTIGEGAEARTFRYAVTYTRTRHYHDQVYTLTLREEASGRQLQLVTNADRVAPTLTVQEIAEGLLGRWVRENFFKVAKRAHGLDQILGHRLVVPGDEDWPVPNPEHIALRRRLAAVTEQVQKLERHVQALQEQYQRLQRKPSWLRYVRRKRPAKLLQRLEVLKAEQERLKAQLASTPERVPYRQVHPGDIQGLDLDRAQVVADLRGLAYHIRAQLLDYAAQCFADERERGKFLDALLHSGGTYRRLETEDVVTLNPPDTPVYRRAAEQLLTLLNSLGATALDGSGRRVRFELEKM